MANRTGSIDYDKRRIIVAISVFLQDQYRNRSDFSSKDIVNLQKAMLCLKKAYNLDYNDLSEFRFLRPLPHIYSQIYHPVRVSDRISADIHKTVGNTYMIQRKYQKAADEYSKAITLDPWNAIYYCNRAAARIDQQRLPESISDCTKSLQINLDYDKGHARMGHAYALMQKPRDAADCYRRAMELSPNNSKYSANLRVAMNQIPQYDSLQLFQMFLGSFNLMMGENRPIRDASVTMRDPATIVTESHPEAPNISPNGMNVYRQDREVTTDGPEDRQTESVQYRTDITTETVVDKAFENSLNQRDTRSNPQPVLELSISRTNCWDFYEKGECSRMPFHEEASKLLKGNSGEIQSKIELTKNTSEFQSFKDSCGASAAKNDKKSHYKSLKNTETSILDTATETKCNELNQNNKTFMNISEKDNTIKNEHSNGKGIKISSHNFKHSLENKEVQIEVSIDISKNNICPSYNSDKRQLKMSSSGTESFFQVRFDDTNKQVYCPFNNTNQSNQKSLNEDYFQITSNDQVKSTFNEGKAYTQKLLNKDKKQLFGKKETPLTCFDKNNEITETEINEKSQFFKGNNPTLNGAVKFVAENDTILMKASKPVEKTIDDSKKHIRNPLNIILETNESRNESEQIQIIMKENVDCVLTSSNDPLEPVIGSEESSSLSCDPFKEQVECDLNVTGESKKIAPEDDKVDQKVLKGIRRWIPFRFC